MVRALPLILVTVVSIGVLSACTPSAERAPCVPSGPSSDAVHVEPATLTATFSPPLQPPTPELTVITQGDGQRVKAGDIVHLEYSVTNATTGELIESTNTAGGELTPLVVGPSMVAGLRAALECTQTGDTVVVAVPADAAHRNGRSDLNVAPDDGMVFVARIDSVTAAADVPPLSAPVAMIAEQTTPQPSPSPSPSDALESVAKTPPAQRTQQLSAPLYALGGRIANRSGQDILVRGSLGEFSSAPPPDGTVIRDGRDSPAFELVTFVWRPNAGGVNLSGKNTPLFEGEIEPEYLTNPPKYNCYLQPPQAPGWGCTWEAASDGIYQLFLTH